jgi:predicted GH43/DUF377 family glycosyl hydrolase
MNKIILILIVVLIVIVSLSVYQYNMPYYFILNIDNHVLDTHTYNPSLVKLGNDMIVMSRRCYRTLFIYMTDNLTFSIIKNCDLTKKYQIYDIKNKKTKPIKKRFTLIKSGPEDPRVFIYNNKIYTLFTRVLSKTNTNVFLGLFSYKLKKLINIVKLHPQDSIDKNWVPFIPDKCLFVRSVQPHNVIYIDVSTGVVKHLYNTSNKEFERLYPGNHCIRCTSSYIETSFGYLAVAHKEPSNYIYFHLFYLVNKNPPYNIIGFSDLFRLSSSNSRIQFISGIEKNGNDIWLSYGDGDQTSNIGIINLNYALSLIKPRC